MCKASRPKYCTRNRMYSRDQNIVLEIECVQQVDQNIVLGTECVPQVDQNIALETKYVLGADHDIVLELEILIVMRTVKIARDKCTIIDAVVKPMNIIVELKDLDAVI